MQKTVEKIKKRGCPLFFSYFVFLLFLAANITFFAANLFFVLCECVFLGLPKPVLLFAIFLVDYFYECNKEHR
jgi:hypothetical protein